MGYKINTVYIRHWSRKERHVAMIGSKVPAIRDNHSLKDNGNKNREQRKQTFIMHNFSSLDEGG
jgi:hypothetical protein